MKPWNIVYIHTHDSGNVFSPYGYKVPTAAIEEFARDAVVFRNAFCAAPTCSPSRAAMLTGRYPHSAGMMGLTNRGFRMKDYDMHLVNLLKQQGYHTVLSGIQHEAAHFAKPEEGAKVIGYDENITTKTYLKGMKDRSQWDMENVHNTCSWLSQNGKKKPFFLSMGFFCTHRPYPPGNAEEVNFIRPPAAYPDEPAIRADFAGHCLALERVDAGVKLVLETLKKTGLYERSIIVFTTDHGVPYPFAKSFLYDSGIAVAFIMRVPKSPANGTLNEHLISQVDFVPTLLDLLKIPAEESLEGISFADYFREEGDMEAKRGAIFAEMNFHTSYEPARCIRTGRYKYIEYLDSTYQGQNLSNVNESPTKSWYMSHGLRNRLKPMKGLYDLAYDPMEKNNVIDVREYREIAQQLANRLHQWQIETQDPLLDGSFVWKDEWLVNAKTSEEPDDYEKK